LETATLLLIILAVFTALIIVVFQYLFKKTNKSQLNYWLSFFRFITLFLILILLINPSIERKNIEVIKPILAVAVDNSTSIKYNSQNGTVKNLVELFKNNERINNKFNINYYEFGANLVRLDSLKFNENQTNLSLPFKEFSKLYKEKICLVVLLTDGNQTIGTSVEFSNYKSPVFPYIVGDTAVVEDIYIQQLNVNKFTSLNNKFPVELFINYTGNATVLKKLSIYYKGKKVYTKRFQFSKNEAVQTASFFLTAETTGRQYYNAAIETLENERNTQNNIKNFSIRVIEEESKILLLTSVMHPDLGMLKKSIESNKQRSVTISKIKNFKGEISEYQLIILNQPTEEFESVFKDINTTKRNYFIISGLSTDWNFLNKIQSNFTKNVINQSENYRPVFNKNYASFLSDAIAFSNFAPLEDRFGNVSFSIPYNSLLFQKIGTIKTDKPLLATFEENTQRGAVLLGENSWRWRINSFTETKTFEYFDNFIANLIQYLTSSINNKRLNVAVKPIFYANETVRFSASYLDKNFNFDARAKLWLTVTNKEKQVLKKIPFAVVESKFIVELGTLNSGEYNFIVTVENQDVATTGKFKVLAFEVEQQFTNSNDEALKRLSEKTNGKVYYSNQEENLIGDLLLDTRFKSIQKINIIKTPLINWKWILALILFTLSVEWFVRKYFGKI